MRSAKRLTVTNRRGAGYSFGVISEKDAVDPGKGWETRTRDSRIHRSINKRFGGTAWPQPTIFKSDDDDR